MKSRGKFVGEDQSAFLLGSPRIIPTKFHRVTTIGCRGSGDDLDADGLAVPFRGGSGAMKGFGSRKDEAEALQRLIARIRELVRAAHSQMRFRRRNKTEFQVLLLDEIARTEGNTATVKKMNA